MQDSDLKPKRQRAVAALLAEPTLRDAAKAAGVNETTLWRWLQEPDFAEAYRAARSRLLEGTLVALQSASVEAVTVLREVMADKLAPPAARVAAARTVLDTALKARQELELEDRLRALEAAVQPQPARRTA